ADHKAFSSLREEQGHFFDVLSHGNKEALLSDFGKPPVACITKPMKFFGVSEAALNGLTPSFIQLFAPFTYTVLTCPLFCVFPNMTSDRFGIRFGMSTFREKRAGVAILGVALVFPVSRAIGGFVGKLMFGRAQLPVFFRYVLILPFKEQTLFGSNPPVSNHCQNFPSLPSLA